MEACLFVCLFCLLWLGCHLQLLPYNILFHTDKTGFHVGAISIGWLVKSVCSYWDFPNLGSPSLHLWKVLIEIFIKIITNVFMETLKTKHIILLLENSHWGGFYGSDFLSFIFLNLMCGRYWIFFVTENWIEFQNSIFNDILDF